MKKLLILFCLFVGTNVATSKDKKSPHEEMQGLFKQWISDTENKKKIYEQYGIPTAEDEANLKFLFEMQKQYNELPESEKNSIQEEIHKIFQKDSIKEIVAMEGSLKQPFATFLQTKDGAKKILTIGKEAVDLLNTIGTDFNNCIEKKLDSKDTKEEEIIPHCTAKMTYLIVNILTEETQRAGIKKIGITKETNQKQ